MYPIAPAVHHGTTAPLCTPNVLHGSRLGARDGEERRDGVACLLFTVRRCMFRVAAQAIGPRHGCHMRVSH